GAYRFLGAVGERNESVPAGLQPLQSELDIRKSRQTKVRVKQSTLVVLAELDAQLGTHLGECLRCTQVEVRVLAHQSTPECELELPFAPQLRGELRAGVECVAEMNDDRGRVDDGSVDIECDHARRRSISSGGLNGGHRGRNLCLLGRAILLAHSAEFGPALGQQLLENGSVTTLLILAVAAQCEAGLARKSRQHIE